MTDTRQVVVTNDSVVVDGRDISHMVTEATVYVTGDGYPPVLRLEMAPDEILYSGPAVVPKVPLDGIERLRQRLNRP